MGKKKDQQYHLIQSVICRLSGNALYTAKENPERIS